ncbi:hypothetical protein [Vibrio alginolyticus]|uniref:hypothetical protein n=1 Tax=Vibrio alginolyticus TaxID=663 RepID=UPI0015F5A902|nr:hypothetical protein [Vibrio alginolyticus]
MVEDDIRKIKELLREFSANHSQAAQLIFQETGYNIERTTIGRILKGKAKPVTIAYTRYALENIKAKRDQSNV